MKKQSIFSCLLLLLLTGALVNCKDPKSETVDPDSPAVISVNPNSGSMGDKVIITGNRFSSNLNANRVKFGNVYAELDSASSTSLYTRIPKDAESCLIEVSVNGKKGVASEYFRVYQIFPAFKSADESANQFDNLTSEFVRVTSILDKVGSQSVLRHGHVWSSEGNFPQVNDRIGPSSDDPRRLESDNQSELGPINGNGNHPYSFTSYVHNLKPETTYQIRAYITTRKGTFYGPVSEFVTKRRSEM
jgi:hypothetical protein